MAKFTDLNLLDVGNTIQLAGAVWASKDKAYVCLLPDEHDDVPLEVLKMTPEEWHRFIRQTDLMETEVLAKAADGLLTKTILRKSNRQIDQRVSWEVFKRDNYRCRYCGKDDVPLTVDHLVRWEESGPSIAANLLSSCSKCNKARGNMSYEDWLQSPRYLQVSTRLDSATRAANEALVSTLASIPRVVHVKSR